ncbi:MAG: 50S ribosomal protein L23 [Gammaproteobacteria bacterium]|nr:50S ribosomal protein L23 [Gammaproteobacteria bacterium]
MSAIPARERLMSVVIGPHLSEKGATNGRQVVFKVRRDSTKAEICRAVEMLFEVKVDAVQVVNVEGKAKRFGRTPGRRQDWKKAYVCLAEGSEINLLGAE